MKKFYLLVLLSFFSSQLWAIESTKFQFPVGFGTVSPMIEVGLTHDDNIFSQDDGSEVKSSMIGILAPAVLWTANSGLNQYNVKYAIESGTFFDSKDDNYLEHRFKADAHLDISLRNRLDLEVNYLKLHERRGTGLSDSGTHGAFKKEPDEYRDLIAKGKYVFGSKTAKGNVEFMASHLDRKYTTSKELNHFHDRMEDTIGLAFIYRFRPNSSLVFEAKHNRIRYNDNFTNNTILDNNENKLLAGLKWKSSVKTTGIAKIGYDKKDFESSQYGSHTFIPWELGVIWSPRSYSKFNLSTSSHSEESTGASSFIHSQNILLGWEHDWSERFTHLLALGFTAEDYIESIQGREDKTNQVNAGLNYLFRRGIILGANYTYKNRNSNIAGKDYISNIFMLSAKIGL